MEIAISTIGGILLLFSVGAGVLVKTRLLQPDQRVPLEDRVGAAAIGAALIAAALLLRIDAAKITIVNTFAVGGAIIALYVVYLIWKRPK